MLEELVIALVYTPGVFAKSAQGVEKRGVALRSGAKERIRVA
jgi:hypothetical protein